MSTKPRFFLLDAVIVIELQADVGAGRITRMDAVAERLARVAGRFPPILREAVDAGELEALALLHDWEEKPPRFCTADRKAI